MKSTQISFNEFSLYDSILNGAVRPFLTLPIGGRYYESEYKWGFGEWAHGKRFQILREPSSLGYWLGSKSIDELKTTLNRSIDFSLAHPPDFKSKCFLDIIRKEYESIKFRAKNFLETAESEEEISFFAQCNIQIAKKIVDQAHEIGRTIQTSDESKSNDGNLYITHILKIFLLRSILLYQELFEPYITSALKDCFELIPLLRNETDSRTPIEKFRKEILKSSGDRSKAESLTIGSCQETANCFTLQGDFWTVRFCGAEITLRALKRTRYVVHLLGNPHKPFYCHELASLVKGIGNEINTFSMNSIDPVEAGDDMSVDEHRIHLIDPIDHDVPDDGMRNIINYLNDLSEKLSDPKVSESEKRHTGSVMKKVRQYLDQEYGIYFVNSRNGRLIPRVRKRLKKEFEKIRINVKKHISKTILDLRLKIPALSGYLKNHIHTGIKCEFRPDSDDAPWIIHWNS